jgi:hypothetical protein
MTRTYYSSKRTAWRRSFNAWCRTVAARGGDMRHWPQALSATGPAYIVLAMRDDYHGGYKTPYVAHAAIFFSIHSTILIAIDGFPV